MKRRDSWFGAVLLIAAFSRGCIHAGAQTTSQTPAASTAMVDYLTADEIAAKAKTLLAQATSAPGGSAGVTLAKYGGHFTMLTVRVKPGGGEFHKKNNDIFVAVDGEATVITGGKLVDPRASSTDEIVGSRVEGGGWSGPRDAQGRHHPYPNQYAAPDNGGSWKDVYLLCGEGD